MGLFVQGFHHIAIIASDYQRSKSFYTQILGAKIIAETYRHRRDSYKLDLCFPDGSRIELFSFPDSPKRASRPEACGLRHLAFKVADLDVAVASLKHDHIECEPIRTDELTGKRFTFFQDPDALPLELYEVNERNL
ncbi:VOC family protein [Pasteurellaceae bacterium LIM206]|nr:VOC family protein [Pasteurellaceae bacterium LIM206]